METATAAFAATDGQTTTLQIFTLEGQSFEFILHDPAMLLESLERAVKLEQEEKMRNALLVKPQGKTRVQLGGMDV